MRFLKLSRNGGNLIPGLFCSSDKALLNLCRPDKNQTEKIHIGNKG